MARPRRARAARSRLGRRRGHQRSLGAGVALGRARRLRLAHARRAPERPGAVARAAAGRPMPAVLVASSPVAAAGVARAARSPPRPSRSRRAAPERSSCCLPARRTIQVRKTRASTSPDFGSSRANESAGRSVGRTRSVRSVFLAAPAGATLPSPDDLAKRLPTVGARPVTFRRRARRNSSAGRAPHS